jgi:hypothetical protein
LRLIEQHGMHRVTPHAEKTSAALKCHFYGRARFGTMTAEQRIVRRSHTKTDRLPEGGDCFAALRGASAGMSARSCVSPIFFPKGEAMKTMKILQLSSLLNLCLALMSQVAFAQADAGAKLRGDAWNGGRVQTYQRHAQDRAQMLYQYAQPQSPVTKHEAKEVVGGIKKDLAEADKALAKLKADHAKEPEVVKQITLIEKHHAKAHEVCGMAEEHCLKEHGDHVAIANCCTDMWHEIDAAQVETNKLLKMLKIEKLPVPKKVIDKKDETEKKTEKKTEK